MNKLPTEIIVHVTSHLSFSDKLKLIRVCKQLYKAITENTLYNELVFKDAAQFEKAMDLFGDKQQFGQQVQQLCLGRGDHDIQLVSRLPTVFTRLLSLEIQVGRTDTQQYTTETSDWNSLERIVDSKFGDVTIKLLQVLTFNGLSSVELSLYGPRDQDRLHDMLKELIQVIHNAPSLENLTVSNSVVEIADMEDLHARATKLKHLKFHHALVRDETVANNNQIIHQPLEGLESFSLGNDVVGNAIHQRESDEQQENRYAAMAKAVKSWIKYIGIKYPQLRDLDFNFAGQNNLISGKELTTAHLINSLQNKKHPKRYSVNLCSSKQAILDVMQNNGTQLQQFGFSVDVEDSVQETFMLIQTAQPVSTVSSLSLTFGYHNDPLDVKRSLIDLCLDLKYLTELKVTSSYSSNTPMLLVEILKNLTMLKSLEFRNLIIDEQMQDDDLFYNTLSSSSSSSSSNINTTTKRLESVHLAKFVIREYHGGDSVQKSNLLFNFILCSCPNLKKIILDSNNTITACGAIDLDFRENYFLKQIKLNMEDCLYYTFHCEPGKRWRSIDDKIMQDIIMPEKYEGISYSAYSVNLAWDLTRDINLQLTGCIS